MTLDEYRAEVDRWCRKLYVASWNDLCGDDDMLTSMLADGWSAEQFVRWFGEKYDLEEHHSDWWNH